MSSVTRIAVTSSGRFEILKLIKISILGVACALINSHLTTNPENLECSQHYFFDKKMPVIPENYRQIV